MITESPVQLVTFRSVQDYAKERGFEESDFEKCGWQSMPLSKAKEALGHQVYQGDANAFALVFHYHGPDGTPLNYATLRIIRSSSGGFAAQTEAGPKMLNPARKPPRVYFPRTVNWLDLQANTEVQIHESVLKAEAAVKKGYVAVGISGCWGWGSKQHRIPLLEDFSLLPWGAKGLKPVVVFDSNTVRGYAEFQELLELATQRFAGAFELEHHVPVRVRYIPSGPNGKSWGYDDWCVAGGGSFNGEAQPIDSDQSRACMEKLNAQFSYDHVLHRIIQISPPHSIISIRDFKDKIKPLRYQDAEGDLKPASEAWLVWDKRRETHGPVYSPGKPQLVDGRVNFWDGWGCEAVRGDCTPFFDLLNNTLHPEEVREFLMWMAFGIQKCGEKKSSKVPILVGPEGIGKSAIFRVLGMIHGEKNCSFINTGELESGFNSYMANKTLVVVDDFTKMDGKTNAKLRNISTNETIRVNAKFQPEYTIQNTAALAFTGNEYDGVKMEEDSRRYFVMRMQEKERRIGCTSWWEDYWKWANSKISALRFALEEIDLSTFKPYAPALMTEGKGAMAFSNRSALEQFVHDIADCLPEGRIFFYTEELSREYMVWSSDPSPNVGKRIANSLIQLQYQRLSFRPRLGAKNQATSVFVRKGVVLNGEPTAHEVKENINGFPIAIKGEKYD